MTISLRLDERLAQKISSLAKEQGVSKSELIRRCVEQYLEREANPPSAWELGKDLFGRFGSGDGGLAKNRKRILQETFRAKHRRR